MVEVRGHDTLGGTLLRWAAERGDSVFVEFEDRTGDSRAVTFAELAARAALVATMLRSHGVAAGTRFHVHLPNRVEFLECLFAGALLGAVVVPTNPECTPDDLAYVLSHSSATLSVTEPALLDAVLDASDLAQDLEQILLVGAQEPPGDAASFEAALAATYPQSIEEPVDPRAAALILYTSGTTGWPKGVVVTHAALLFAGEAVAEALRIRRDDRWLVVLPLFHGNALYYSVMSALVTGASIALIERFEAASWAGQVANHRATLASLFATPLRMVLATDPPGDPVVRTLRTTVFAQHVTDGHRDEFERRFGCPLVQLYGMTETVVPPLMNPLYGDRRNRTLGRPIANTPVRVVDDEGNDVPTGDTGELLIGGVPGETMMLGYHENPVTTGETLRDGWLHTGDRVSADADGYLLFQGRVADVLKPQLDNVSAAEIERVVLDNWAVHDCAAIGVADPVSDEAIMLFVTPQPGETLSHDEIHDWCTRHLAEHKRPSLIELVPELPRTAAGKLDRGALRRRAGTYAP